MKNLHRRSLAGLLVMLVIGAMPLMSFAQKIGPQFARPADQRGLDIFENPKADTVAFDGMRLFWGGSFTQPFQALSHENSAEVVDANGVNTNQLMDLGAGFNLASANLNLDVQLADGIRVNLITYLSSRRHSEAWVKGGYFQIDKAPMLKIAALDRIMDFVTLKLGHFEINYGDAHFRRTDNGNALYNPFVGNYIMDAFTTEIGGEVYFRTGPFLAMGAVTGGEIKGDVTNPDRRGASYYGKLGVDQKVNSDLRLRLTGSAYTTAKSANNTLYSGDRAGSRYHLALENALATPASSAGSSGLVNPGIRNQVTAVMINPFVKFGGAELFGVLERATGSNVGEAEARTWNQIGAEAIYRFLPREQAYVGARYNIVTGELAGSRAEVKVDRIQVGGGWFVTPNVLLKGEYVMQNYNDFPTKDIRHGGKFNGFMIEGVVSF